MQALYRENTVVEKIPTEVLLGAYVEGVFPMSEDGEIYWFQPKERGIIPLDDRFHIPHGLKRAMKKRPLEDAPSVAELNVVVSQLGIRPWDLLRRGESVFKELGLNKDSSDKAVIEAMAKHPILIERPVVIHHDKAALGRPPENTLALFK